MRPFGTVTRARVKSMRAAGQHVDDEVLAQISAVHKINFLGSIYVDINNQR